MESSYLKCFRETVSRGGGSGAAERDAASEAAEWLGPGFGDAEEEEEGASCGEGDGQG